MKKIIFTITLLVGLTPFISSAHGIVQDGHDAPLRPLDYIELVGIGIGSLGMIIYSLDQWRKDKKKK